MPQDSEGRPGADRRTSPRAPIVVREARCIAGMEVFFGYATNISCSGLFIVTPKKRVPGEVHEIQFSVPGDPRRLNCRAEVVWVRPYRQGSKQPPGFGVRFLDLAPADKTFLAEWVERSG